MSRLYITYATFFWMISDERFVEITTVLQGIPGFGQAKDSSVDSGEWYKTNAPHAYICNYR